jgi:hypothetical protein
MPYILAGHLDIDADQEPDSTYHFDADQDPAYHFDPDPVLDPTVQFYLYPDPQH